MSITREELEQFKSELKFTLFARGSYNVVSLERVLTVVEALEQARAEIATLKARIEATRWDGKDAEIKALRAERDVAIERSTVVGWRAPGRDEEITALKTKVGELEARYQPRGETEDVTADELKKLTREP